MPPAAAEVASLGVGASVLSSVWGAFVGSFVGFMHDIGQRRLQINLLGVCSAVQEELSTVQSRLNSCEEKSEAVQSTRLDFCEEKSEVSKAR